VSIGGRTGWYYGDKLWALRGMADRMIGGFGLRRGRRHPLNLHSGDALDFWRVIYADKKARRLLLFAEMKIPGEAWLEFRIESQSGKETLLQTATFRPKGLMGRLYWYMLYPFHAFIFSGMCRRIEAYAD